MDKINLKAEKRALSGRKVKSLRSQGFLPANLYGKAIDSQSIQVSLKDFEKVYEEAGETQIISLQIGDKSHPVLISNVQIHPVDDFPIHVDFRQVNLKEKIEATVPVETVGESPAEKEGRGTAVLMLDELQVEALPTDLPEKFEVDLSTLTEVDQAIHVSELQYDRAKVEIKNDAELIIVKVEPPQKEEEIAPPPPAEGEEAAEVPVAEGETPVPGGEVTEEAQEKKES